MLKCKRNVFSSFHYKEEHELSNYSCSFYSITLRKKNLDC